MPDVAIGVWVHQWQQGIVCADIQHPGAFTLLLFLIAICVNVESFRTSKPKRSKRLFHMSCPTPATHRWCALSV